MLDATERRRSEADLKAIETYAQNIVDTVREPLLILDTTLRVRSANRAFYQTFQVSLEETVGQLVDFATEIYPGAHRLGEYRRLRLRRAAAGLAPRLALLWFPDLAVHRIRLLQRSFDGNWWSHLRS